MGNNTDIAEKLQALRDGYGKRLPQELAEMENLIAQAMVVVNQGDSCQKILAKLHQRLHKLAGSAGSFGFDVLGAKAKQLELEIPAWLSADIAPVDLQNFSHAISALHTCLQADPLVSKMLVVPTRIEAGRQTHIYLLEDDPSIAEEISLTLRHFGHRVTHFNTLQAAEAAIHHLRPDFMVVDILFEAEGRESPAAIAALQEQVVEPLPVIFISSRSDFAAYHAAVKAGAVGYFVKPLDAVRLVDRLEYYLERRHEVPYRVLIVDDDLALVEHYRLVLQASGMSAEIVTRPEQLLTTLRDFNPELILLDLNIPVYSGPDLAKVIRLCDEWMRVPITYLSGETDIDQRVRAMGQAGDDFIAKPISDRELVSAVSVRAARSRQLSDAMDRDSLTGLLKHSRIKEQLDIDLSRVRRTGERLSVAMIDLDYFKMVNDTYGHAAGDKVIKALAHLLRQRLRKTDSIGRYGGEEFAAVLPGCGEIEALRLLNDVRQNFKEINFNANGRQFNVTLSAGVATLANDPSISPEQLLQMADDALYLAKHGGRDQVRGA